MNNTETNISTVHERIQNFYAIEEKTWTDAEEVGPGIWRYSDVLPENMNIINNVSKILENPITPYEWRQATVGYYEYMPEYRDCYDFKYKPMPAPYNIQYKNEEWQKELDSLYSELYFRQLQPVKDYAKRYNIGELRYWEAINFVKYGPGEHFQEHHDHGYSYNCTVSLVAYPNDDYEGGELYFRLQNVSIKPKAGDLYVFPSNFMYPHRAMPVISGTKYSLVTMLDYSDKFHSPEFYKETGS